MAGIELPPPKLDQGFEDTESIDDNIDNLFQKFIAPIDNIRSIAEAPKGKLQTNQKEKGITDLKIDPINFMESRGHAFYRLLGLPVIGGDSFYNPGYDPQPKNQTTRDTINSKISKADLDAMETREQVAKLYGQLFAGQGFDATLFGFVLRLPKPFNTVDAGKDPVDIDFRTSLISGLKESLPSIAESLSAGEAEFAKKLGYSLSSVKHIIKPVMVNPAIDFTVMPSDNKVCVPFLKNQQSTKISSSPDVFLLRPGIEFIIRARLRDNNPDKLFLSDLESVLEQVKSPSPDFVGDINTTALIDTLQALAGDAGIDNIDVNDIFGGATNTQATIIKQLIKTIKVCVRMLLQSITTLHEINEQIVYLPIPNVQGFEKGSSNRNVVKTKIERDLVILTTKKLNADRDINIERDLGNFATSQFINLEKSDTYDKQIKELTERKDQLNSIAAECTRVIDIITGESSGFGLVDVLAVYTALWTIKIDELLALLDNDSFERLYEFNVQLRSDEVEGRKEGIGPAIKTAIESLESKIKNVLVFADYLSNNSTILELGEPS